MIRPRISRCRSCLADIIWTVTESGKKMPVDAEPVGDGNITLADDWDGTIRASYFREGDQLEFGEPRYVSHFSTCSHAAQHRSRR